MDGSNGPDYREVASAFLADLRDRFGSNRGMMVIHGEMALVNDRALRVTFMNWALDVPDDISEDGHDNPAAQAAILAAPDSLTPLPDGSGQCAYAAPSGQSRRAAPSGASIDGDGQRSCAAAQAATLPAPAPSTLKQDDDGHADCAAQAATRASPDSSCPNSGESGQPRAAAPSGHLNHAAPSPLPPGRPPLKRTVTVPSTWKVLDPNAMWDMTFAELRFYRMHASRSVRIVDRLIGHSANATGNQRPSDVMNRKTFDRIVEEENCDAD